jgi:hypothetical protein
MKAETTVNSYPLPAMATFSSPGGGKRTGPVTSVRPENFLKKYLQR